MSASDLIPIIAPELVGNPNLSGAIDLASSQVAASHCQHDAAVAYLAAHILTVAGRDGSSGTLDSESEGSLSRSFSSATPTSSLDATSYGQEFQRLNKICYGFSARTGWCD